MPSLWHELLVSCPNIVSVYKRLTCSCNERASAIGANLLKLPPHVLLVAKKILIYKTITFAPLSIGSCNARAIAREANTNFEGTISYFFWRAPLAIAPL